MCTIDVVGKEIKRLRIAAGLSQRQLAMLINTDFSNISRWENNKTHPSLETIFRLAEIFSVEVAYFFIGDERIQ